MVGKDFNVNSFKTVKTKKERKHLYRAGMPDNKRRDVLLQMFGLNPMNCEAKYQTIIKSQPEEFLELAAKQASYSKQLEYQYLSEYGKGQFD